MTATRHAAPQRAPRPAAAAADGLDHPLLRLTDGATRERLLSVSTRRTYAPGDAVFRRGDTPDGLHLLLTGHLAVNTVTADGDRLIFSVLGPGDIVGEMALLGRPEDRSSDVEALDEAVTLLVPSAALRAIRRACPDVEDVLLDLMAERIRRLSDHLLEALHTPADKRVVRRLLVLSRAYGAAGPDGGRVPLGQAELAALAGTTRQTANRVLQTLREAGAVTLTRAAVTIVDRRRLLASAR